MNENLNLVEILKDCPKGTKLYSTIYGEVTFSYINNSSICPIIVRVNDDFHPVLTKDGRHAAAYKGECTLFPAKDQRDWSKFTAPWYKKEKLVEPKFHVGQYVIDGYVGGQITSIEDNYHCYKILDFMGGTNTTIPFTLQENYHLWTIEDAKDDDVLAISWWEDKDFWEKIIIFKKYHNKGVKGLYSMPCVEGYGNTFKNGEMAFTDEEVPYYSKTWTCNLHPATKEQRSLLFQKIKEAGYKWNTETNTFEKLVSDKFDPKTLKSFDKVLVRDNKCKCWVVQLFSHIIEGELHYPYACINNSYKYCIPYNDDTKHLVGTSEETTEFYRYWED